jgi:hypothetical protein
MSKSYEPQVLAYGETYWCGNALRFATRKEAEDYVFDLSMRLTGVKETRVVESDDEVNYTFHDGKLRSLDGEELTAPRVPESWEDGVRSDLFESDK